MGFDMRHHLLQVLGVRDVWPILPRNLLLVVGQFVSPLLVDHSFAVHHVDLLQDKVGIRQGFDKHLVQSKLVRDGKAVMEL